MTRIYRLARSIGDLQDIVRTMKARGASLKTTEQPIDTSSGAGKGFLDMLGVFTEFETNLRRLEGIARAKAEHIAAPTTAARVKKAFANPEPSTHRATLPSPAFAWRGSYPG